VPHLQRAVALDPNFAMAYATLGVSKSNLSAAIKSRRIFPEGVRSMRTSQGERERFYILAHYYDIATGDIEKSNESIEGLAPDLSRDSTPLDNLALSYSAWAGTTKSVSAASESLRLDAKDSFAYEHLPMAIKFESIHEADRLPSRHCGEGTVF